MPIPRLSRNVIKTVEIQTGAGIVPVTGLVGGPERAPPRRSLHLSTINATLSPYIQGSISLIQMSGVGRFVAMRGLEQTRKVYGNVITHADVGKKLQGGMTRGVAGPPPKSLRGVDDRCSWTRDTIS